MANTPNTIPTKRLAATIDGSATLIKLNNILDWSGTALTSAYLGDILYAVLRDQDNTVLEIMQLDPTTIANNSTTGITILRRGLKFNGDLTTEVTANKLVWIKNQTIVEIGTDVPQIFQNYVNITDDQTVAGIKTFSSFPQKSGSTTPTQAAELATKAYVDTMGTGSSVYDQNIFAGTAGETLASGNIVYFKLSDQRWWKADSSAASTSIGVKLGVAQAAATAGNAVNILGGGLAKNMTGLTAGNNYFLSTSGGVSTTSGTYSRFLGRAVSTTSLHFDTSNGFIVSQSGIEIYGVDSSGTDAYAITVSPAITAYTDGLVINFKAGTTNTSTATININSIGAKTIKKNYNTTLADGDIQAGQIVTLVYDLTNDCFQMQSLSGLSSTVYFPQFGNGADGDATIASGTTSITKDMYYNNLTIQTGGTLDTAGYRVFVKGTLTFEGTGKIARNGNTGGNGGNGGNGSAGAGGSAGTAGTAGTALASGTIYGGEAGGAGAAGGGGTTGGGSNGTNGNQATTPSAITNAIGSTASAGTGNGGNSGGGFNGNSGGTGGAAGTGTSATVTNPSMMPNTVDNAILLHTIVNTAVAFMKGSAGSVGGSGGAGGAGGNQGAGTYAGGGGGGGGGAGSTGGIVMVAAYQVVGGYATCIQALGGTGGNGGNGGNPTVQFSGGGGTGGGGNGGTGGVVIFIYHSYSGTALSTACVAGGAGGSAGSTAGIAGTGGGSAGSLGAAGATGATGKLYSFQV